MPRSRGRSSAARAPAQASGCRRSRLVGGHTILVEQILGRPTLFNARWRERQALWDGRRAEIVRDYGVRLTELARTLEWDYVHVPPMPVDKEYRRP